MPFITRDVDGAIIGQFANIQEPNQEWVDVVTPSARQQQEMLENAVQNYLDSQAQLKGYDSILSACSYAAAPNVFQAEGQSFLTWRAACWAYCYQVQIDVKSGTQTMPTADQLISGLPIRT